MNQDELKEWGLGITKDIYNYWKKVSESNDLIKKNGFAVFYSPINNNSKLLIIGLNPGGKFTCKDNPFNPDDIIKELPTKHDYLFEDWNIAKSMRELFSFDLNILKNSVKFNFYFFRTSSENELRNLKEFPDIYEFCSVQTMKIIEILQPDLILTEGLGVFDILYNILDFKKYSNLVIDKRYRILQKAVKEDLTLIGMIHPSGGRTRRRFNNNQDKIIEELKKQFDTQCVKNQKLHNSYEN